MGKHKSRSAKKLPLKPPVPVACDPKSLGRRFWLLAALIAALLVASRCYKINRPFSGLHSWGQASGAWAARSHVKYGLGYTKGIKTLVVGDPPPAKPNHYLSHPQLSGLIGAAFAWILGCHDWTFRAVGIPWAVAGLFVFLGLLRRLVPDATALLAGLLLVMFPISVYFGTLGLSSILYLLALGRYLALIGRLGSPLRRRRRYLCELGGCFFLLALLSWNNAFIIVTIAGHYVIRSVWRYRRHKEKPSWALLGVIVVPPLLSMAVNFVVMLWGYDWQIDKIVELYKWRSAKGEESKGPFSWSAWFVVLWRHSVANFTLPAVITFLAYIGYLIIGSVVGWVIKLKRGITVKVPGRFPELWFFAIPPVLFLLAFRGLLWVHQYWQRPFALLVTIATALAIMLLMNVVTKLTHRVVAYAVAAGLVVLFGVFCWLGLFRGEPYKGPEDNKGYFQIRWQSERTLDLFKKLNKQIPPDKALLGFKDFIIKQHASKPAFYRPEYAWYLDRPVVAARSLRGIREKARTGRFPYYFIPDTEQPPLLSKAVKKLVAGRTDEQMEEDYGHLQVLEQVVQSIMKQAAGLGPQEQARRFRQQAEQIEQQAGLYKQRSDAKRAEQLVTLALALKQLATTIVARPGAVNMVLGACAEQKKLLQVEMIDRRRKRLINQLKKLYEYEYFYNTTGFNPRGNTPCYIFDLQRPRTSGQREGEGE